MIAISYRSSDSAAYAGRIYGHLTRHFREDEIFLDVEALKVGSSFPKKLQAVFELCDVALIVIGPNWAIDYDGNNRLNHENDWVRKEVRTAINNSKCLVIPILVNGVSMPDEDILPNDILDFHEIQGLEVRHKTFKKDMEYIIECIHNHLNVDDFYDVITQQHMLGIVRTTKGFPSEKFKKYASTAKNIYILQTWIPDAVSLVGQISEGLNGGAKVHILFLDPDSISLAERSKSVGLPTEVIRSEIVASKYRLMMLKQNIDEDKGSIEVRLYDSLPSMRMYMADEVAFVSFLLFSQQASNALNLEVRDTNSDWHKLISNEFRARWDSAEKKLDFITGNFINI
jgi:hypothetical protein